MEPVALAERPHHLAQLRLDERVEDDRAAPARAGRGEVDVLRGDDARVADDLELLARGTARSTASTTRVAVSPVASETTWSSTGSAHA